ALTAPSGTAVSAPDPMANAVLADFIKGGVKVFYLGPHSGMHGWFLFKDNQIQIAYAAPDNRTIIFGAMYDSLGNNVSADQIRNLYDNNKEVHTLMTNYNAAMAQATGRPGFQMGNQSITQQQAQMGSTPSMAAANDSSQILPASTTLGDRLMRAL